MPDAQPLVYVIDDDEAVRDSLTLLFDSESLPVRAFPTADAFLDAFERGQPGCVVADVRMPGLSGVELLEKLQAERSALPVILITGHGDVPMAVTALKAGAADFFEKPFDDARLVASVRAALDVTRARRQRAVETSELEARAATLTAREREVMDLIVAGHSNQIVAARLAISPRTVEVYRARVMEKMQANSLADIVRMAIRLETSDT
jgi:two-component system response regulator FixJ